MRTNTDRSHISVRTTLSFSAFYGHVEKIVNKVDDSKEHGENQLDVFTRLNFKRLGRIYKTVKINEHLRRVISGLEKPQRWMVITEAWCGDSAQSLPILAKIAEASEGKIELEIVFRDDNPDLMVRYHSNGSKSIPKLIAFDGSGKELFTWGPRPKAAQDLFESWKASKEIDWETFEIQLHKWYALDKGETLQLEILEKAGQTTKGIQMVTKPEV